MKNSAKIISIVLSVAMVLSIACAFAVNSFAVSAPVFSVKEISKKYNTVTVEVNLVSGSFNSLDLNFSYSKNVKIKTIEYGSALKTANAMVSLNPNANTSADHSHVSMVATSGYNQTGQMIVATFQVPYMSDYTISIHVTDCRVTVGNNNVEVKPTVSSSVSYKYEKPTSSTTSTTTKKTTTDTTTKNNQTKPTAKPNNSTTKPNTTIRTAVIPGAVTVTSGASGNSSTAVNGSTTISEPTDENLDIDEYSSESAENTELSSSKAAFKAAAAEKVQLKQSHNTKTIIIVAAAAVVFIAGAVVAIVLINKKKNDSTSDTL